LPVGEGRVEMLELNKIYNMDCLEGLKQLDDNSINCCVTSPPYWGLRDYGVEGQIGLEKTPEEYVSKMVEIFREVKRVLRKDGTLWLNLGDSYANANPGSGGQCKLSGAGRNMTEARYTNIKRDVSSLKPKDLVGIPWMVAFALRADGWYLRQDIIWHKPNAMPESVKDRPTRAHEYIFLLSKSPRYYYDADAIREPHTLNDRVKGRKPNFAPRKWLPEGGKISNNNRSGGDGVGFNPKGRNKRSVWTIPTRPFKGAHFAVFPPDLIEPCILAGCPAGGVVLDPFMGSGTTGVVAAMYQRNFIGFELNPEYCKMAERRIEPYLMQQTIFELR
jgi:DNA modification methylase